MEKRVFTIAPGAPFLATFARALAGGRIVEGYSAKLGPLAFSDATIYVPTRRAARVLAGELAQALGCPAILPRILPLGSLEEADDGFFAGAEGPESAIEAGVPEAANEIFRRMQLAELILKWARALNHAIVSVDENGRYKSGPPESPLVAAAFADAWHLSGELARLIDELIIGDIAWKKLDPLVLSEFDDYWRITLDFLNIAINEWPKILDRYGLVDRARRQVALIASQCRRLRQGSFPGPVIAAGSTGTNRATARLLAAIVEHPQGAVVLPGLDLNLSPRAWAMVSGGSSQEGGMTFTHPQSALARLLADLAVAREQVACLGIETKDLAARSIFVSQALSPAESTDDWRLYRNATDPADIDAALAGVSVIEAADEREEALALAIAMREVLETPRETAALITADRKLARRVHAELKRWGIDAADTAGEPLSARLPGSLALLLLDCATNKMAAGGLTALFAHPLFRLGYAREEIAGLGTLAEIGLLRSSCAAGPLAQRFGGDWPALIAAAKHELEDRYAHEAKKRISAEEWTRLDALMARLGSLLAPLMTMSEGATLPQWVAAHSAAIEKATASGEDDIDPEDQQTLDDLFEALSQNAPQELTLNIESYGQFFARLAQEAVIRDAGQAAHPRIQILGLLEARLIDADVVLLGALEEAIWPPNARSDAFLNRPMREALGLTPPERRLGQTAHDFTQAMGKRKVILSRARKRDGTPAVPSRFLQRMAALGGKEWQACRASGDFYCALAREIDRPAREAARCERPQPKPALGMRPKKLSVTEIETLRRDPYAIYAAKILRLKEFDPLGGSFGAAERGTAIHAALARFVERHPSGPLPLGAQDELRALLREALGAQLLDPAFAALGWPRADEMIANYLGFEAKRRERIARIEVEKSGELEIELADGSRFHLKARADRIEWNSDGSVTLVDYKTGGVPKAEEISKGFAPQLTLEAAMAKRGAFGPGAVSETIKASYLKLGGADGGKETPADAGLAEEHYRGLIDLLNQFRDEATAYPPRPYPKFAKRYSAYEHLARVKEWSRGSEEEASG